MKTHTYNFLQEVRSWRRVGDGHGDGEEEEENLGEFHVEMYWTASLDSVAQNDTLFLKAFVFI
jgi:hypothetical protein